MSTFPARQAWSAEEEAVLADSRPLSNHASNTEDATVGVTSAGTIPYFTGRTAVDFLGKSDVRVARLLPDVSGRVSWNGMSSVPGHNKYDLNYSLKTLRPTYAQVVSWCSQDFREWSAQHYAEVSYKGVPLRLLRNSKSVRWNLISNPQGTMRPPL